MNKVQVETFVTLMDSHANDHGCSVSLEVADEEGFSVFIRDEDDDVQENQRCRFEFVKVSLWPDKKSGKETETLLRVVLLFNDKAEGGWLVSASPAAAFAVCWSGT